MTKVFNLAPPKRMTAEEQLTWVQRLIPIIKHWDADWKPAYNALKQIARDLNGRTEDGMSASTDILEKKIRSVQRRSSSLGYDQGSLIDLGREVYARWAQIKCALEQYEEGSEP